MIGTKKPPQNAGFWPVEILEAMDKLWEFGVTPSIYRDHWEEQADHQGLDYDPDEDL